MCSSHVTCQVNSARLFLRHLLILTSPLLCVFEKICRSLYLSTLPFASTARTADRGRAGLLACGAASRWHRSPQQGWSRALNPSRSPGGACCERSPSPAYRWPQATRPHVHRRTRIRTRRSLAVLRSVPPCEGRTRQWTCRRASTTVCVHCRHVHRCRTRRSHAGSARRSAGWAPTATAD